MRLPLAFGMVLLAAGSGRATVIINFTFDTSALIGHVAGPFSLNFQLNDGAGVGDGNNTATIDNFNFGAGGPSGLPVLVGGASGDLGSVVTITDTSFLNIFTQGFTAGAVLGFRLTLSTNVSGFVPDQFSMAILDSTGFEIPTMALYSFGTDAFIIIDIDSATPALNTFSSDLSRAPNAGGPPINIPDPIPEPSTTWLTVGALAAAAVRKAIGARPK